ncbi:uncharacterized protein PAC_06294 [Phialocephala subalpina]|uniref:Uncharacterized protein n=1 Tax=Phialocephala subalpina TaxID=576137 RepID=A0A1L7WUF3_9HELO|nr:uncharacterized protein PAC_06294 [Phialocephala subalpina]
MKSYVVFANVLLALIPLTAADTAATAEEVNQHIDIAKTGNIYCNAQFNIACNGCSLVGDLSVSGGCDDTSADLPTCIEQRAPDANFSMLVADFTEYWLGIAFDDFQLHFELDISLTPTQLSNEVIIHPLGDNGLMEARTKLSILSILRSTAGSTPHLQISPMDLISHLAQGQQTTFGFNGSTLTPTAFQGTNPNLQFDFSLSFRPLISANAKFLKGIFSDTIVYLAVSQVLNVINDYTPAPAGTDSTHIYKNLTHVVPIISTDFDLSLAKPKENLLLGSFNGTALPTQCLDFDAKSTSLIVASAVRPSSGAGRINVIALPMLSIAVLVALLASYAMGSALFRLAMNGNSVYGTKVPGGIVFETQTFSVTRVTTELVMKSNGIWLAATIVVEVIGLVVSIVMVWTYWAQERSLSLSPVETIQVMPVMVLEKDMSADEVVERYGSQTVSLLSKEG